LVTTVDRPTVAGTTVVRVDTAAEMEDAVLARCDSADVVVMAAAVADFRPVKSATSKIKKANGIPDIVLEPTPDILVEVGRRKTAGQTIVGFAAETDDVLGAARSKLVRKGADFIVANDVSAPGTGFEHDTNQVVIVSASGIDKDVALTDKRAVARAVFDAVVARRHAADTGTAHPRS
jgi:phosphopantothenoylcysteine decarboxylase/phosphopantothenate--cysteine ligase